jgi:hypothetical protein
VLLAAAGVEGLISFDLTDPADPVQVNACFNRGCLGDVVKAGNLAFLDDSENGLRIVDVSNPSNPVETAIIDAQGSVKGMTAQGRYVYASSQTDTDGDYFWIADVIDPAIPQIVGSLDVSQAPTEIIVRDRYAYGGCSLAGLQIFDVSDPSHPTLAGQYPIQYFYGLTIWNNLAYLSEANAGSSTIHVIDISDPTHPASLCTFNTAMRQMEACGDYLYGVWGSYAHNVQILDISDPANPVEVSNFESDIYSISDLDYHYGYLYLTGHGEGLRIFDVCDPASPFEVGYYNTPGNARAVFASAEYAYIADDYFFGIYDCSDAVPVVPEKEHTLPAVLQLHPAYPNPFNAQTVLSFSLPKAAHVTINIYDITGRDIEKLVEGWYPAGTYKTTWDPHRNPSGIYIVKLTTQGRQNVQKVLYLK